MNKFIIPLGVGIVALLIILVFGFTFYGGSKKPSDQTKNPTKPTVVQTIDKDTILESKDGGITFVPQFKIATTSTKIPSIDVLSIAFHPAKTGTIVAGSVKNGIFRSENGAQTWNPIVFPPQNIYSFILDRGAPDTRMFASGVLNNYGRVFRTDNGGTSWRSVYTEPGQKTIVTALSQHPLNANIIFLGTDQGTLVKSTDGGDSWKNVGNKIQGNIKNIGFDAVRSQVNYMLTLGSRVYYSEDAGNTWIDWEQQKKDDIAVITKRADQMRKDGNKSGADQLKQIANDLAKRNESNRMPGGIIFLIADPRTSGTLYAGTNSGLFRSIDFGKYWTEVNIIESAKKFPIKSIAINPLNSSEISFIAGKSFYKSKNYGDTWSVTDLNTTHTPSLVTYDPFNTQHIFIGLTN